MSRSNGKKDRKAAEGARPGSPPAAKRRRHRLPVHADLRFDDTLAANEHHPLAATSPEVREASRLRLIACVLARMARAAMKPTG